MVTCSRCGATLNPNASFCGNCGTAQATNPGAAPQFVPPPAPAGLAYAPAPASPQKKGHPVLKVLGIIFAVFVGFAIWGAILQANHTGGQASTSVNSGSHTSSSPLEESRQMCSEIREKLELFLKNKIKGIECQPAQDDNSGVVLVIGYPLPALANNDIVKKNTLLMTYSIVGQTMASYPNIHISKVYALDSSRTSFAVSGSYAQQLYLRLVNNQLSEPDAREEVIRIAKRVNLPEPLR